MNIDLSSVEFFLLSLVTVTLIVIVRYFAVSGFFAFVSKSQTRDDPALRTQMRMERAYSLASCGVYGMFTGATLWAWSVFGVGKIYGALDAYPLWWALISVPVYLVMHDTYFYWTHRWTHRPRVYRAIHYVHHKSHPPTAWAAMSFHLGESVLGAIFIPLITLLVPIHVIGLAIVATIASLFGTTNHLGWEIFPSNFVKSRVGKHLITASHHEQHHRKNKGNYALYFRFWDKMCGTDRGLADFHRR